MPKKSFKKIIYLDNAAATPIDFRVKRAMEPFWSKFYGNPSSLNVLGRESAKAILKARKVIAKILSAKPEEIIFTAGGTEGDNLATFGVAKHFENIYKKKGHIITSTIEHNAVLSPIANLAGEGWEVSYIKVDNQGFVRFEELKASVRPNTALISIMYANNEIGTIEPIALIGKWLKAQNLKRKTQNLPEIVFHTDACQAAGVCDVNVQKLNVDLMTVNGSKIYGPKQTGFLYVRSGTLIEPLIHGGGQERGLRSGTENVAGIVGLGKAFEIGQKNRISENRRLQRLNNYFVERIFKYISNVELNGPFNDLKSTKMYNASKPRGRAGNWQKPSGKFSAKLPLRKLPNNINISFKGVEGESLVLYLDTYGICVSSGSACSSHNLKSYHVIRAIGKSLKQAKSSVRFTLGKNTTRKDIDYVIKTLLLVVEELRKT